MRRYGLSLVSERLTPTGVGIYGLELARAMAPLLREDERLVVFRHPDFPWSDPGPAVESVTLRFPAKRTVLRRAAEQTVLAAAAWRAKLELLHTINFAAPLAWRRPLVVTLHDARILGEPGANLVRRAFRAVVFRGSVRRATRLVADSASAARDSAQVFGLDETRIRVIHLGVDHATIASIGAGEREEVRAKLGLKGPALVFAGEFEPHKNLPRLLDAFEEVARERPDATLVLAGGRGPDLAAITARTRDLGERVLLPGYLPRRELLALVAGARALAFPSLAEGFGLPVLEAFAAGTPVVTSSRGSLAEVAGDAALIVDPEDTASIAAGLRRIVSDDALALELSARGRERAARFTWQRTAADTLEVYRSI
jgi:glycosyltransferase involved in cell wall biosynthesis